MEKLVLRIIDLHCPACVMRLEGIEDDLAGIASAKASYQKQIMEIVFDEAIVDQGKILAAIQEMGYTPAALE